MAGDVSVARRRSRTLKSLAVLAVLAGLAQSPSPARADMPEQFAHITCAPEIGLFKLDYLLAYLPHAGDPHRVGAYGARELEAAPQTCVLPGNAIIVSGQYQVTGRGPCGGALGQRVRVSINGAPVAYRFSSDRDQTPLADGWIELSRCFDGGHTVEVRTNAQTGALTTVEVCSRTAPIRTGVRREETSTVNCYVWKSWEEGYPFAGARAD